MPWDFGKEEDPPIFHEHPINKYKGKRGQPKGPLETLVPRHDWGAADPSSTEPLHNLAPPFMKYPPATMANHIHFSHTATAECSGREECAKVVQPLQRTHMDKGETDILHSFMVGGDGQVYEGRGWDNQCNVPEDFTIFETASLDIAMIGDFSKKKPTKVMINAMKRLIDWGIVNKKLYCCYYKTYNYALHNMYLK